MMKKFLGVLLCGIVFTQFAHAGKGVLSCKLSSSYLSFKTTYVLDLSSSTILGEGQVKDKFGKYTDQYSYSISESECEDSTDLFFNMKELNALKAGKIKEVWGRIEHAEPDVELKGTVLCTFSAN